MALQGKKKIFAVLQDFKSAYAQVPEEQLASFRYVPLDFATIHIRVYSDGSFQNLPDKQNQVEFIFVLADGNDRCNLFYWDISRSTHRPASTEEAELLALDFSLPRFLNQRRIM